MCLSKSFGFMNFLFVEVLVFLAKNKLVVRLWSLNFQINYLIVGFWLLLLVFLALVLFLVLKYISLRAATNANAVLIQREQAVQEERHRISREMHDDIGVGLSAIKLYISLLNEREPGKQNDEIDKLQEMFEDITNKIQEVIWSLNLEYDSLESLLYYIQFQTVMLFKHSKIKFSIDIPEVIPNVNVSGESRRNITLIIKEALHNVIKHSDATESYLEISIIDDLLNLIVYDNGQGIYSTTHSENGMGLKNIYARLRKLDGNIEITSERGTEIKLRIPLKNNPYLVNGLADVAAR